MIHRKKTPIYVYFISFLSIVVVAVCVTVVLSVLSRKPKVPSVTPKSMIYFGTVCTLNLFEDGTQALYNALFNRLEQIETEFDPARASSDISQINAAAGDHAIPVNSDITYVLRRALAYAELSGGLFDPTIGSITKLWQIGTEEAHIPNQRYIKSTLELVDYHSVVIDGDTVFLEKKGMSLDLGALVKGSRLTNYEKSSLLTMFQKRLSTLEETFTFSEKSWTMSLGMWESKIPKMNQATRLSSCSLTNAALSQAASTSAILFRAGSAITTFSTQKPATRSKQIS